MRAIRVRKRSNGNFYAVHWLTDDEETTCRLPIDNLNIVEELDLDKLPAVEGCRSCQRITDGWTPTPPSHTDSPDLRVVLAPSLGRVRKTGTLNHRHQGSSREPSHVKRLNLQHAGDGRAVDELADPLRRQHSEHPHLAVPAHADHVAGLDRAVGVGDLAQVGAVGEPEQEPEHDAEATA